jgi:hypothetical protein
VTHTQKEEAELFFKTLKWLYDRQYTPTVEDLSFYKQNEKRLSSPELLKWLGVSDSRSYTEQEEQ